MVELHWAIDQQIKGGNAYGYWTLNVKLKEEFKKIANITHSAKDALIMLAPEFYHSKIPGYTNWLFTMFEGSVPEEYQAALRLADYLIAPSKYVKDLFSKYVDEEKIHIVPLGVERVFKYKRRRFPKGKPFRYLWLGAPNPRKGWEEVIYIWKYNNFHKHKEIELYLKTTAMVKERSNNIPQKLGNVIFDNRQVSRKELIKIYHSAHCFLFPTRGEGFGLTLAEAMRTGTPCIATNKTGHMDFFDDDVGYTIDCRDGKTTTHNPLDHEKKMIHEIDVVFPDVNDLVYNMLYIRENYDEALKKAKRASKRIAANFTWQRSAKVLYNILKENSNGATNS